jgi:methionine-rich copper-binding protein CopC
VSFSVEAPRAYRGALASVLCVALGLLFVVAFALPASAHAERVSSQPEAGAELQGVPTNLAISFSEPPTGDALLEVLDGCGNDVVQQMKVQNQEITAQFSGGQPGSWTVRTSVVSGVDGHPTKDSWKFSVAGKADCSQEAAGPRDGGEEEDGSSFPVIPVLIGTVVVLLVAVLLRVLTGRSAD